MDRRKIEAFINEHIDEFHENRIHALSKLRLINVLKRKNPYLFKAKNILTCEALITTIVDAFLSSQEETIFGEFLEKLAIFACHEVKGGYKSGIEGIDLEIGDKDIRYIIAIKSGPNWGNSSQINKMKDHFKKARKILCTQNSIINVIPINGCCYGKDRNPNKGDYYKFCGQAFWEFITDDENFYLEIIEPLGYKAKEKNDRFWVEYGKVVNKFTREFSDAYCLADGAIDWVKIVEINSGKQL